MPVEMPIQNMYNCPQEFTKKPIKSPIKHAKKPRHGPKNMPVIVEKKIVKLYCTSNILISKNMFVTVESAIKSAQVAIFLLVESCLKKGEVKKFIKKTSLLKILQEVCRHQLNGVNMGANLYCGGRGSAPQGQTFSFANNIPFCNT